MPIYRYLCPKCNTQFEQRQSFTDESVVACPNCRNGARRLFSPVPIIFKGSGFYVTDHNAGKSGLQNGDKESKKVDQGVAETGSKAEKKKDKGGDGDGEE